MKIPGFDPRAAAELDALHRECQRSNDIDALIVRESIAFAEAMNKPGVERQKLRWQIATGYARRRQRSAA